MTIPSPATMTSNSDKNVTIPPPPQTRDVTTTTTTSTTPTISSSTNPSSLPISETSSYHLKMNRSTFTSPPALNDTSPSHSDNYDMTEDDSTPATTNTHELLARIDDLTEQLTLEQDNNAAMANIVRMERKTTQVQLRNLQNQIRELQLANSTPSRQTSSTTARDVTTPTPHLTVSPPPH